MAQTSPINDDTEFRNLELFVNSLANSKGYIHIPKKGSASWTDKRIRPVDAAVRFKLCFWGKGQISFGVRKEWASAQGITSAQLQCTETFAVQPSPVEFIGVRVHDEEMSRQLIERIVSKLTSENKPSSNGSVPAARPAPGLGKGSILYMSPDFDEPLEEFKEYTE
ncbi:MAG TPA: hypothetical protein VGZ47_08720 [Gemmataceae bacterium]|nr:hypothetical protein [Gemmataceae bacterium]